MKNLFLSCLLFIGSLALVACTGSDGSIEVAPAPPDTNYTVILSGGTLYDGLGNPPIVTDIGIVNEEIVAFGDLSTFEAPLRIDVTGLAVVPGFIDVHSHASGSNYNGSGLRRQPSAENYIRQGVTTAIVGQDGTSPYPIDKFLQTVAQNPRTINLGTTVGHGTIRAIVMGNRDRKPTDAELAKMKEMVVKSMKAGALGVSSGLEYTPGAYAKTDELIDVVNAGAAYGGIYTSHMRDEGGQLLESIAETIRIGEEGGLAPHITHHKVIGKDRWGNSIASLALVDEARDRGVDVMSDVYPYTASSTSINILFPAWSKEGNRQARLNRLRDPEKRLFIRNDIVKHIETERGSDPSTIVVANCTWNRQLNGKSLADILTERNKPVTLVGAAEVAMELEEKGGCMGVFHSMSEEDVQRIMQHPMTMIASDGGVPRMNVGTPHPRNYGTFARVLARYVRELEVLSFEEAVRKMTSLPASRLGLEGRGSLRVGGIADLAVLDPATIQDHATFQEPHQYASGVQHVFVAGEGVMLNGEMTGEKPGKVLKRNAIVNN
ncbi:MAG: D-aminoacylase [Bacteroidota bacterium]